MNFIEGRPIYLQIMDEMIQQIITGKLMPGQKVPAVREMALEMATNPNTVQRSLQELERMGILFSERGKGRFVTENQAILKNLNQEKITQVITDYLSQMEQLGFTAAQALEKMRVFIEEERQ